jgi:polar amino acid transport system permease protein/putative glutamine transport system permease protein
MFLRSISTTFTIVIFSMFFGFILGVILALMRRSKTIPVRFIATFLVDVLRNTPFLVQLFFIYYGLPELGINTEPVITSIIALSINVSASNCEVLRAGLLAVKNSYYECAYAIGFKWFQVMRFIVIPISLRIAFKPLTSNFINLVLSSSVAFAATTNEIMGVAKTIASFTSRPFEIFLVILVLYCLFTFIISFTAKAIDKKISITL